ncbi:MAG: 50S ribosomal protein L6 [Lactobacillales bacterium]|jgi:large subunit ribosomal protein L6|nr:50S ribosomal protein L6 [Lactobacillales bacterium]
MSRVGKYPVKLPSGVTVTVSGDDIVVKGKLGELKTHLPKGVTVKTEAEKVSVQPVDDSKESRTLWGTVRANLNNMVKGVSDGFTVKLELIGVGYRAAVQGQILKLTLGFSHDIDYVLPKGVKAVCPQPTIIELTSTDKQLVGQTAAEIRSYRKPEPYKGKGVKYSDERVLRKVGKKK